MSEPNATPAADAPLSIDGLTALFDQEEKAALEGADAAESAVDEPAEDGGEEQEAEADENLEAQADEEEQPDESKLSPPTSWAKEDHEAWNELSAKAQAVVLKREADRDKAVSEATTKAGRAAAEVKALAENYEKVAANVTDEVTRAKQQWVQAWGDVDWQQLAASRPDDYIRYKAQADAERERIGAYENHLRQVAEDAQKASKLARAASIAEEETKLRELAPELVDPAEGKARRGKVTEYLVAHGFAPEVLLDISAVELSIAHKAMLYDNAQKAAKQQAALPRKNPTSTVKSLPASGSAALASTPKRELQAASQRLTKTGRLDDLVRLFDAEDAARERKAGGR